MRSHAQGDTTNDFGLNGYNFLWSGIGVTPFSTWARRGPPGVIHPEPGRASLGAEGRRAEAGERGEEKSRDVPAKVKEARRVGLERVRPVGTAEDRRLAAMDVLGLPADVEHVHASLGQPRPGAAARVSAEAQCPRGV